MKQAGGCEQEADSRNNWERAAGLREHMDFVRQLLERYQWPEKVKRDFQSRLSQIEEKQRDSCLNLSVIGDFNSGKSTFINALIRQEVLSMGVIQGTTVAATFLEDGMCHQIITQDRKGNREGKSFCDLCSLRQALNGIVSENNEARLLDRVTVRLPASNLNDAQLRIIDTPGLDANVQWHSEVTARTLRTHSDLSIILVDATRPLPDALCRFLTEHLADMMEQSVFVVTKMDLIRPKERKMLLYYIAQTARARWDMEAPVVLPYSAHTVLRLTEKQLDEELLKESLESEETLLRHTARQKAAAQMKKLLALIDHIYQAISQEMDELDQQYAKELERLLQTKQTDLRTFVAEQKQARERQYDESYIALRAKLLSHSDFLQKQACQAVLDEVEKRNSLDALNEYIKNGMMMECRKQAWELCTRLAAKAQEETGMTQVFQRELDQFQSDFSRKFQNLPCLPPTLQQKKVCVPGVELPELPDISVAGIYAKDMLKRENSWAGGGTATGAAIGTLILPGVGTVVGAGLGLLAGLWGAEKDGVTTDAVRQQTRSKLFMPLSSYFSKTSERCMAQVDQYVLQIRQQMGQELERYLEAYESTVRKWIVKEEKRQTRVIEKRREIWLDLKQVQKRRLCLDEARLQIQAQ